MKRMFVVPALLLAMSVSSQAETSLVMTRVDGGMQELRNFCLESEHFDIRKCFFTMDDDTLYCMAVSV